MKSRYVLQKQNTLFQKKIVNILVNFVILRLFGDVFGDKAGMRVG